MVRCAALLPFIQHTPPAPPPRCACPIFASKNCQHAEGLEDGDVTHPSFVWAICDVTSSKASC
eukprot:3979222-Pleurochrysis_carterae.AAC.1